MLLVNGKNRPKCVCMERIFPVQIFNKSILSWIGAKTRPSWTKVTCSRCSLPTLPPTKPSPCRPTSEWSSPLKRQIFIVSSRNCKTRPAPPWSCPARTPTGSTSSSTRPPPPRPCSTSPARDRCFFGFEILFEKSLSSRKPWPPLQAAHTGQICPSHCLSPPAQKKIVGGNHWDHFHPRSQLHQLEYSNTGKE